MSILKYWSIEV